MVLFVGSSAVPVKGVCRLPDSSNVESQDPWKILYTVWTKAQISKNYHIKLINEFHISIFIPVLLFKGPVVALLVLRRTTMDHENREVQQISAVELRQIFQFSARHALSQLPLWLQCLERRFFCSDVRSDLWPWEAWASVPFFLVHPAPRFGCRFWSMFPQKLSL